jgi:hypothetical protein
MRKKTECYRASWLTVAEAREILSALDNAKVLKYLDGSQRRHVDAALTRLSELIVDASGQRIELPPDLVGDLLRSVAACQNWLDSMFDEFRCGE